MERSSSPAALEALPRDVLQSLNRFFVGIDLLRVSRVNRRLRALVDDEEETLWPSRLVQHYGDEFRRDSTSSTTKRRVLSAQSLRFRGCPVAMSNPPPTDKGSCADIRGLVLEWGELVAFDLSFSLLPGDDETYEGGVLLGVQSAAYTDPRWPFYNQQFIVVDGQRDLYCSVISHKPRVAKALETNRWYHLACMFDGHTQRVLLDGELVSQVDGTIHHEAYSLRCMQIGTGCVSAGSRGRPTPTFTGWYGFHGVVDEFRTWGMTLSNAAIQRLAHGELVDERPRFSLRYSGIRTAKGGAKRVYCSRPRERLCELY